MRNLYLIIAATCFLTACGGGSGGDTPPTDTVPPVVTASASATFAAIDAAGTPASGGAIAAFLQAATANDNVDGSVSVTNDAPDVFPLDTTTVVFSASDAAGNTGTATAIVTVTDQAAPVLIAPADASFVATSAAGIAATDAVLVELLATASASDNVDTAVTLSNDAPAIFPIGDTPVKFTVSDVAGNKADAVTLVTVTGRAQKAKGEKGPLFRATVFFDYDGDKELDANEPSTLTDINGEYELVETSDAPDEYLVVLLMNENTIDGITGESYADSGVTLEAVKGSEVITPMTTLYSIAVSDLNEGEELTVEAFSSALGLPEGVDINTYSAYVKDDNGDYIDVETASQVEAVAQSLMTTLEVISESVVSISRTALRSGNGVSQTQAATVALKSLANVIAATAFGNTAGGVTNTVDLSNVEDIAEVNAAVLESLNSDAADSLGALLETTAEAAGIEVDKAAAEVTGSVVLSLSINTIATVSKAFNDLDAASFGQVEASAVSLIKAQVVSEIAAAAEIVVAAVAVQQEANETVELVAEDVDISAVITLDNEESLNATVALNIQEVEAYLVTTIAPVIESVGSFFVAENQTSVGAVIATDTAGDVLAYSLSGADADALTISSSGVIGFVAAPDFETKTLYSITVTVVDSNGNSASQIITISITDANDDAPVITSPSSFTVNENQSVIGSVVATSASPGAVLTFILIGGDALALTISSDGLLGFADAPDFEEKASYSTAVVVSDGNNDTPDTEAVVTVSIVNLNDSAPVITSADQFTVQENSKSVGAITATDADFSALTYALTGTDASAFTISSLGSLSFKAAPNFEIKSSYSLTVTVSDGVDSTNMPLTINIADTNDVSPEFTSEATFNAEENQASIGTVTATDVDTDSALITFSISGEGLAINSAGVLSFEVAPDYEANVSYAATVTATDGINSTTQDIVVTVTDIDDITPVITSSASFSAAENQAEIGTISATDVDSTSITFSVSGDVLTITDAGVLSFVSVPDYEVQASYTATITATDGSNSVTQIITVAVTDVDDVAPTFTSSDSFSAAENQTAIGTVTATDIDSATVTFSVSSSEVAISAGGVLSFVAPADYEVKSAYSVVVTATDGTNSATQTVDIEVQDANDNAPVISSPAVFDADENQTAIGVVTASDADSESITFSVSGDDLAITAEGVLSFKVAPDYEVQASYTATITASDGSNSVTQVITVAVTDVDDVAPTFTSSDSFSAAENQTAIGTVTATDIDSATVTFSVSSSEVAISAGGVLSFVAPADYEVKSAYSVVVTATDGTNSATQTVDIEVQDANDNAPVISSPAVFDADENQTAIGVVTASDDDSESITFSVSGNDLAITAEGVLSFKVAPDYEASASYTATITASDSVNLTSQEITITVNDVNDVAPVFISGDAFSVVENQTTIGSAVATDSDSDNASITFSISGDVLAITDAGVLSFVSVPDYEVQASYTATITATDGTNSVTQVITVAVTDVDDVAPTFTSSGSFSAAENQTAIGTVTATDIDSATVTFSVSSSEVAISAGGVLSFVAPADYEVKSAYSVLVTATDGTNSATQTVDIEVQDANDNAPVISSPAVFDADENQTAIGVVTASDADSESITFSVSGDDLAVTAEGVLSFKVAPDYEVQASYTATITATDGSNSVTQFITVAVTDVDDVAPAFTSSDSFSAAENQTAIGTVTVTDADSASTTLSVSGDDLAITSAGVLSFVAAPDYETDVSYTAVVTATDGVNQATQTITIVVSDIDDEAPTFTSSYVFTVVENQTAIGTVTATDVDSDNGTITFSISGNALAISDAGVLSFSAAPDFESNASFTATVTATDGVNERARFITVTVTDIDDEAPVFSSSTSFTAAENQTAIGTVSATDVDSDDNAISFSVSGDDLEVTSAGVLSFSSAPDYEKTPSYKATITATDGANQSEQIVTITVTDKDDTFTLSDTAVTLTDYYPLDGSTVTNTLAYTVENGKGNVDLRAAPLNLTNIQNALYAGDFKTPVVSFGLSTLPIGSGAGTVSIDLIDGVDGVIDTGERQVKVEIAVEWESDGTTASITVPQQTINASYKTGAGVQIDVQVANVDSDILTVAGDGVAYPATLQVKLVSLITQLSALPLADILSAGIYHVDVSTSLPLKAATGETLSGVSAIIEIADAFKLADAPITLQDSSAVDGSITASDHVTSLVDGFLTVDMRDAPLSLLNIEKGLYGLDFTSPKVLFSLSAIPSGTGTETVTINLIDGTDAVRGAGERQITVALEIEWDADGNAAAITAPAQDLTAYYLTGDGVRFDVALTNADLDVLSVTSAGAGYPASLELKLLSLITKLSGLPLADILSAGEFHLDVTTSMPLISPAGLAVEGLKAVIKIQDDMVPVFTSVASFSAAENQFAVGTVTATAFDSGAVEFSISGSDLKIDATGLVSFISTPDYEANATYTATVTVMDGDRSTTQVITVTVTDKDDTFTLSDTAVTLTDYYPLDGSTVTNTLAYTVENGKGNVDLRAAPLNLTNIQNALYAGDFKTPVVSFGLSTLPIGSGAGTVSIDLIDGVDGVIDTGERQVKVEIAVEWESDGTTASITVPQQTINASYKTGAGVQIDVQVANVDSDILTVAGDGVAYPATLQVKLVSLITQLSALPLADILSAGIYHVDVSTSLPLKAATGETLSGVSAIIEIADAFKLADAPITLQDSSAVDGSITASDHVTSLVDGFLTVDMRDAPLSLLNIEKGLYGLDFTSPKVLFSLSAIPSGTGTETVTINLIDGTDAVRGAGERQITVALEIEWDADGNAAAITAPAQDLTAYYLTGDGVRFDVALTNADLDVLSVTSAGAGYPASLELKLLSLITKLSGLPLADILSAGEFHLDVTTSMPLISPAGLAVEGLKAIIEIRGQP